MTIDYSIFYKKQIFFDTNWKSETNWDIYISAYSKSKRIEQVFKKVNSKNKKRVVLPEYQFQESDYLDEKDIFVTQEKNEKLLFNEFFETFNLDINKSICLDITGFMRPQFIYLIKFFHEKGIKKFDVIYTEPNDYLLKDETTFSDEYIDEIRQINSFEGNHTTNLSNDILIIGAGYDDRLISGVAEKKDKAKKVLIFGFPSLQADMIQHNILRSYRSKESLGLNSDSSGNFLNNPNIYYAPAYDPFITANILQKIVVRENSNAKITNLYLSPLSAKPQALGFALYYIWECINKPISIIFPFCQKYEPVTTSGIGRIWKYTIQLP